MPKFMNHYIRYGIVGVDSLWSFVPVQIREDGTIAMHDATYDLADTPLFEEFRHYVLSDLEKQLRAGSDWAEYFNEKTGLMAIFAPGEEGMTP